MVCLEEIQRIVEVDPKGAAALGRAGVREVAVYLDSKVPPPPYTYTPPPPPHVLTSFNSYPLDIWIYRHFS